MGEISFKDIIQEKGLLNRELTREENNLNIYRNNTSNLYILLDM
jgi:hypothetical protein